MSTILSVLAEGLLDIWCFLLRKQRDVDESSTIGQTEFEKEGPGILWALIIGGGFLVGVLFFILRS